MFQRDVCSERRRRRVVHSLNTNIVGAARVGDETDSIGVQTCVVRIRNPGKEVDLAVVRGTKGTELSEKLAVRPELLDVVVGVGEADVLPQGVAGNNHLRFARIDWA